jgi:hypothetical protein
MWIPQSYSEIEDVIGSAEESEQLDFKRRGSDKLPLGSSTEIAKDIASMTLDGGVLIYGVDEKQGIVADAITPIPLKGARERIQQVAQSAIHPPPWIDVKALSPSEGGDDGVVVVAVPPSPLAPHMANDRYPARSGTTTRYLSEREVERLHEQRRLLSGAEAERNALEHFVPPAAGFDPSAGVGGVATLRMLLEPPAPQPHPAGARLKGPLEGAVQQAEEELRARGYVAPHLESCLTGLLKTWDPRGAEGWESGYASTNVNDLQEGPRAGGTYMYRGGFSFEVSQWVEERGQRVAWEHIWALEAMAALMIAGRFYVEVHGVSFLNVDFSLQGLEGAVSYKSTHGYTSGVAHEIKDHRYVESAAFPVAELADDPRNATRELLDRLFASFLGQHDDIVADISRGS